MSNVYSKKFKLPTQQEILAAVHSLVNAERELAQSVNLEADKLVVQAWENRVNDMLHQLCYPPSGSNTEQLLAKILEQVNEYVFASNSSDETDADAGDFDAMAKVELVEMLRQALKPPFKVSVEPLEASNGVTYVVCLDRADTPRDLSFFDSQHHQWRITPLNRNDVDEANEAAAEWAEFLRVGFTPAEVVQSKYGQSTVPEYGAAAVAKLIPADVPTPVWDAIAFIQAMSSFPTVQDETSAALLLETMKNQAAELYAKLAPLIAGA